MANTSPDPVAMYRLACAECAAPPVPSLDLQNDGRLLCRNCAPLDHSGCFERCGTDCPAPVFDDEEFYDGHADHDGTDDL